jgi:hypothetical protein
MTTFYLHPEGCILKNCLGAKTAVQNRKFQPRIDAKKKKVSIATSSADSFDIFKMIWCWKIREYLVICQKTSSLSSIIKLKWKQKQETEGGEGVESDKIWIWTVTFPPLKWKFVVVGLEHDGWRHSLTRGVDRGNEPSEKECRWWCWN